MANGGCCCARFILVTFNLIFLVLSLVILIVGIITLVDADLIFKAIKLVGDIDFDEISKVTGYDVVEIVKGSAVFLVVLGAVVLTISVLGCLGACCGNRCILGFYAIFLVIIVVAEVIVIIVAAVLPAKFKEQVEGTMKNVLEKDFYWDMSFDDNGAITISPKPVEFAWAHVQIQLKCCGAANYTDYYNLEWQKGYEHILVTDVKVPASCCVLKDDINEPKTKDDFKNLESCLRGNKSLHHEKGCYDGVVDFVMAYDHWIIGIAVAIGVIELLLIGFTICIYRNAGKSGKAV